MGSVVDIYSELEGDLENLFQRFISNHVEETSSAGPLSTRSDAKYKLKPDEEEDNYKFDVQAYTVLSHAAFEDYFENVAISLMKEAFKQWDDHKIVTVAMVTQIGYLLSYSERQERIMSLDIKKKGNKSDLLKMTQYEHHVDNLRQEAESFFTKQIKDNHGIAIDYLLHVLIPVSININQDADMMDSLRKLKDSRGEIAHKRALTKLPSPSDIWIDVNNCRRLCEDIKDQVVGRYSS